MARIKDLKKEQRKVRRVIRKQNKNLKEDCFAGRFQIRQTNRVSQGLYPGWVDKTYISKDGKDFGVAGHSYHLWYKAAYEIEFIDNEQPERNYKEWFECWDILNYSFLKQSLWSHLNEFILSSDFWKKWNDPEYARTHWFSGAQLKEKMKNNKNWLNVDMMIASGSSTRWNKKEDQE